MKRIIVLVALLAGLLLASKAQAFEILSPNNAGNARIEAGQSIDDTVFAAGQNVDVRGLVSKDLFAAGGTLSISSPIGGNVIVAGGTVNIDSTISGDLIVAGGTVTLAKDAVVSGDVMVFGGSIQILGTVKGDTQAYAGDLNIDGTITGNVKAQADKVSLGETAQIGGTLTGTVGNELDASAAEHVSGAIDVTVGPADGKNYDTIGAAVGVGMAASFMSVLFGILSLLVTGLILILLMPKFVEHFRKNSHTEPLNSGLLGLGIVIGAPVIFVLCMIFLITIPLGMLEIALLMVLGLIGNIAANLWVGDLLGSQKWSPLMALAVGAIVLMMLGLIPLVGALLQFIAWLVGMGSVGRILWNQLAPAAKGK